VAEQPRHSRGEHLPCPLANIQPCGEPLFAYSHE
jgi:hypothetical protein